MKSIIQNVATVYGYLQDDYSKQIYANRLLYSFTDDVQFVRNIVTSTKEGKSFVEQLSKPCKKVVFGSGFWGKEIVNLFKDYGIFGFVDNKPKNNELLGLPVLTFDQFLAKYSDCDVVITTRAYHKEIFLQLIQNGIPESRIINFGIFEDAIVQKQYFDLPALADVMGNKEVFVDCGAFDGMSSAYFCKKFGAKVSQKEIICFEPDEKNAQKCKQIVQNAIQTCGGGIALL